MSIDDRISITFPLSGINSLTITIQSKVTKSDFERIKTLIELAEESLVEPDKSEPKTLN